MIYEEQVFQGKELILWPLLPALQLTAGEILRVGATERTTGYTA